MRAALVSALMVIAVSCGAGDDPVSLDDSTASAPPPETSSPVPASTTGSEPPGPLPAGVAFGVSDGVIRAGVASDAPVAELVAGWNDAGLALLRKQPAEDNVVFSPASIGHALLMAAAAGDDPTRAAIESAFGLPDGAHEAWNAIDLQIAEAQSDQVSVAIADRIWPRVDVEPDQAWIDLLASRHGADVVPLDYVADREGSRRTINGWVAERTERLIPELLPDGFIKSNTVLVLTDALYFAADWARPFGK
jgi:serpin B